MTKREKAQCTQKVIAECTDEEIHYEEGKAHHFPVFEFDYENQHFRVTPRSNSYLPEIGTKHELFINPKYHNVFYHPETEKRNDRVMLIFKLFIALIFLIPVMIMLLSLTT